MSICFVIQPFDKAKFDRRYTETFKPAIEKAGFEAYRVDEDPSVSIPIDEIEKKIKEAVVCLAEITTDNANVWFELGYAIACGKPVVMISEERARDKFPFDVQHRNIVRYGTETASDFTGLGKKITERLSAIDKSEIAIEKLSKEAPLAEVKGLSAYERIVIAAVVGAGSGIDRQVPEQVLRNRAGSNGLTDFAIALALKKLSNKGFVYDQQQIDREDGREYLTYALTESGWKWILENEHEFALQTGENAPFESPHS